jgi:aldose 1-epimerase
VQDSNAPGQTQALGLAVRAEDPVSGRILRVFTSEPGVQFYTANWYPLPSDPADKQMLGKSGRYYYRRNAFAIETQHFPDSPNRPEFPSTVLRPGQEYQSTTIFAFRSQ